jgi:phage-related protein
MNRPPEKPVPAQPPIKPIGWCGSALDDLRSFPEEARREAGFQLGELQEGKEPDDWKPMTTVGAGTMEIRIHTGTEHRVFVVSKFAERIYVLHAFEKKSQRTPQRDIDLAKRRYRQLIQERQKR